MYEAPIKLMQRQLEIREENGILNAIKEVGVVVDKEELIKALKYDRGQYDKGYSDGIKEFANKLTDRICEKLNQSLDNPNGDNYYITDVYTDIDNLEKEMLEGGDSDA